MTDVTRDSILTALTSLILGYKDKNNPGTETEALNTLRQSIPDGASFLTFMSALRKIFHAFSADVPLLSVGMSVGKFSAVVDEICDSLRQRDKTVEERLDLLVDRISDQTSKKVVEKLPPVIGHPLPEIPLTPVPVITPIITPAPYRPFPDSEPWVAPPYAPPYRSPITWDAASGKDNTGYLTQDADGRIQMRRI